MRAEAQLANPSDAKPAAAEQANLDSETATLQPLWNIWSDVHQAVDNYYHKQLFHTALITIYMIVKPTTAENKPIPTHTITSTSATEDCDTVKKLNCYVCKNTGPNHNQDHFQSVQNVIVNLRVHTAANISTSDNITHSVPVPILAPTPTPIPILTPPILTMATYPNATITTGVTTVDNMETVELHETTQNDSEEREEREGMWRNEISKEKDTEESIEKEKRKTERRIDEKKEAKTEDMNEVYTAKQAANDDTAHQQPSTFDWATKVDVSDSLNPHFT